MISVFWIGRKRSDSRSSRDLLFFAMRRYCSALLKKDFEFSPQDLRIGEWGKPYLEDSPFEFSISHSGEYWAAAFSDKPVGLDIQVRRSVDWEKIARRFFRQKETKVIMEGGEDVFLRFWSRREAFGKMTGGGFFSEMPPLTEKKGVFGGSGFQFYEPDILSDIFCCVSSVPDQGTPVLINLE